VDKLQVEFVADLDNLRKGLAEVDSRLGKTAKSGTEASNSLRDKLTGGASTAAASLRGLAAAAAAFGTVSLAATAVAEAAALASLSANASLTTTEFQRLTRAMALTGADIDGNQALATFAKNVDLARKGAGEMVEVLKFMHPELLQALKNSKGTADALNVFADALSRLSSAEDKAALARKAFGDAGANLIPILEKGSAGLRDATKEVDKFATILSKDAIESADRFGDEWSNLMTEVKNQAVESSKSVLSAFADAFKSLRETLAGVRNGTLDVLGGKVNDLNIKTFRLSVEQLRDRLAEANSEAAKGGPDRAKWAADVALYEAALARALNVQGQVNAAVPTMFEGFAAAAAKLKETTNDAGAFARTKLGERPDFRGVDAVSASRVSLASARGNQFAAIDAQTKQEVETARRLLSELALSHGQFEEIRTNATAAGAARRRMLEQDQSTAIKALQLQTAEASIAAETTLIGQYNRRVQNAQMANDLELANWKRLYEQQMITAEQFEQARVALAQQQALKVSEATRAVTADIESAVGGAFNGLVTNSLTNASGAAKQFGLDLVNSLAQAITKALILKPLMDGLFNGGNGGAGSFAVSALGSLFGGPARAEGGAVMAGVPTLVNERAGRRGEVFVPQFSGRMVPAERYDGGGRSGGSGSTINIDARGSDAGVTARVMAAVEALERQRASPVAAQAAHRRRFPGRAA
jgi:hypothetical protein